MAQFIIRYDAGYGEVAELIEAVDKIDAQARCLDMAHKYAEEVGGSVQFYFIEPATDERIKEFGLDEPLPNGEDQ